MTNVLRRRTEQNNFKSSGYLWPMMIVILLVMILIGGVTVYHHYEIDRLDRYPFRGVSVTQQDGYVDFFSLSKTGQKFVYIKASQGSIYTDNDFNDNYQRAEGSGLDLGVYHVFSFDSRPQTQFRNFSNQVADHVGSLPIAVRVSHSGRLDHQQLNALRLFITAVKRSYHRNLIIWTSDPIARQLRLGRDWINNSASSRERMTVLNPKETLNLDGQDNNVTQFVFNGDRRKWHRFTNDDY